MAIESGRPGFSKVSQIQENQLLAQLATARELIRHPAEKGRSLEGEVAAVLRELLPAEYGIGTGFVVYHGDNGPELSAQLDIIIYDAIRGGAIGQLLACEIYPIEVVYCYIEVKASISLPGPDAKVTDSSIQACMIQNSKLRKMNARKYWNTAYEGSPVQVHLEPMHWLSLRGFVFAFEASGNAAKDPNILSKGVVKYARAYGAHLHGLLILGHAFITTIPVEKDILDPYDDEDVSYTIEHTFTAFKMHLLKALGTFPRPPEHLIPAWEIYFELPNNWKTVEPER